MGRERASAHLVAGVMNLSESESLASLSQRHHELLAHHVERRVRGEVELVVL